MEGWENVFGERNKLKGWTLCHLLRQWFFSPTQILFWNNAAVVASAYFSWYVKRHCILPEVVGTTMETIILLFLYVYPSPAFYSHSVCYWRLHLFDFSRHLLQGSRRIGSTVLCWQFHGMHMCMWTLEQLDQEVKVILSQHLLPHKAHELQVLAMTVVGDIEMPWDCSMISMSVYRSEDSNLEALWGIPVLSLPLFFLLQN